jgi:uncharacterized RmlC-like cupin family protein
MKETWLLKTELKNIASVRIGYSFRARLEWMNPGGIGVIQMKDLTDENRVDFSGLIRVGLDRKLKEHHVVRPGDLVVRSRGLVFTSAIVAECPASAVVAAPLFLIRPEEKVVLPEYLHWFIHQPPAQVFLSGVSKGTSQKMIDKEALENLQVAMPSLDRQRAITELAALAEKERRLIDRIARRRGQYISATMMRFAEGE